MRAKLLVLAAVLSVGATAPALAAWDRIGSVDFSWRGEHEREYGNFGGPVERLNFRAQGNGVMCRSVRATFRDGDRREIFQGVIREGRSVDVDVPGRQRWIRRLDFNCRSDGRRDATIQIFADIGRYRDEWRRSPDWDRLWSGMFHWNDDRRGDSNRWVSLGRASFEGRNDVEGTITGWRGRSIEALALRPVNGDARCRRVMATFDNGRTRLLNINGGDYLPRGSYTRLDLPGGDRDVRRITMQCRAVRDYQVTIELFAQR